MIDIDFYALVFALLHERLQRLPFTRYDHVAAVPAHFFDYAGDGNPG